MTCRTVFSGVINSTLCRDSLRLRYTRGVIAEGRSPYESRSELAALESELAEFKSSLPETMKLTTGNLSLRGYTTSRTRYIMLHVWWYQCHCDLYRFMIPRIRESISEEAMRSTPEAYVQYCQQKAADNALNALRLFTEVKKLANPISIADQMVAICCYQCARIIIVSYMMPGIEGLDRRNLAEIDQLYVLVNILEDLVKFYPQVGIIVLKKTRAHILYSALILLQVEDIKHMIQSMKTESVIVACHGEKRLMFGSSTQIPLSTVQSPRICPMNAESPSQHPRKQARVIGSRHGVLDMMNSINTEEDSETPANTGEAGGGSWLEDGALPAPERTHIGDPVSECLTEYGDTATSNTVGTASATWPMDFEATDMTAMETMLDPFANIHEDWSTYQFSSDQVGGIFE